MTSYTPRFITKLWFEDNGGLPFILLQPLTYVTDVSHRGTFSVPTGFKTDLASIPRALWSVVSPIGKYDAAAVLHDYLYQTGGVTRAEADATLNEAMGVSGVGRWTRWTIYSGVRVGGWVVWNKYRSSAPPA